MEVKHIIGKSCIYETEKNKQVEAILQILKEKKQTYAINKFVLEEAINQLQEIIF